MCDIPGPWRRGQRGCSLPREFHWRLWTLLSLPDQNTLRSVPSHPHTLTPSHNAVGQVSGETEGDSVCRGPSLPFLRDAGGEVETM